MGRPSENKDNPLQYVRVLAGMTQEQFAAALGVSKSEISKRETRAPGFEDISESLMKKVAQEFGAIILPRAGKKPWTWGRKPLTKEYIAEHRRQRLDSNLVKYPPADVLKALGWVAEACGKLRREELFCGALEQAVKAVCISVQLRHEIRNLLKKTISLKKQEDVTALIWLAGAIEDDDLVRNLPTLPTILEWQKQVEKNVPGVRVLTRENIESHVEERLKKGQGDFRNFDDF